MKRIIYRRIIELKNILRIKKKMSKMYFFVIVLSKMYSFHKQKSTQFSKMLSIFPCKIVTLWEYKFLINIFYKFVYKFVKNKLLDFSSHHCRNEIATLLKWRIKLCHENSNQYIRLLIILWTTYIVYCVRR